MNRETIQIEVPRSALVAAFLEKVARASAPDDIPMPVMQERTALLPAIGGALDGGVYAGITVHANLPMALVLLPEEDKLSWSKALDWAKAQGGMLPSRFDALTLFKNLKGEFNKDDWYWTSEEYAGAAGFAWLQGFDFGGQHRYHKSVACRCRAVRRVAI